MDTMPLPVAQLQEEELLVSVVSVVQYVDKACGVPLRSDVDV